MTKTRRGSPSLGFSLLALLGAYAGRTGLKIVVGGDDAFTSADGTVVLPFIDIDDPGVLDRLGEHPYFSGASRPEIRARLIQVIKGYAAHEAAHHRYTNFAALDPCMAGDPFLHAVTNILEDVFIERQLGTEFPGLPPSLEEIWRLIEAQHGLSTPTPEDPPAKVITDYLRCELRTRVLGQGVLADTAIAADTVMEEVFGPDLARRIDRITARVPLADSSLDNLTLAQQLVALVEQEKQEAEARHAPPPPPSPSPSADSDPSPSDADSDPNGSSGSDADAQPSGADTGSGSDPDAGSKPTGSDADPAPTGSDTPSDGSAGGSAGAAGGDGNDPSSASASAADGAGSATGQGSDPAAPAPAGATACEPSSELTSTPGGLGAGAGSGPKPELFQAVLDGQGLDPSDPLRAVAELLEQAAAATADAGAMVLPVAYPQPATDPGDVLQRVLPATGAIRQRLKSLVQAEDRTRIHSAVRGRRVHGRALHRAPAGDPRIFERRDEQPAVNTAVHLVIDTSGSMNSRIGVTCDAALALAIALHGIPKVTVSAAAFPGNGLAVAAKSATVAEVLRPGVDPRRRAGAFVLPAGGGTPLAGALVHGAAVLLTQHTVERRLMLVLHDGEPNDPPATLAVIARLQARGIAFLGIGIQTDAVRAYFPDHVVVNELADLRSALFQATRRALQPSA